MSAAPDGQATPAKPAKPGKAAQRPQRQGEPPVVVPPRFVRKLELANGKNRSLTADEMEGVRRAFREAHQELGKLRGVFVRDAASITGLKPEEVAGAFPETSGDLGRVDTVLAEKAAKAGKRLESEDLASLREALRDYAHERDALRDDLVAAIAKAVDLRKSEVDDLLPEDGFPGRVGRL
jgi:hypothetical protein